MMKLKMIYMFIMLSMLLNGTPFKVIDNIKEASVLLKKTTKKTMKSFKSTKRNNDKFIKRYFGPWDLKRLSNSKRDAQWGNGYKNKKMYRRDGKRVRKSWFVKMIRKSNFSKYGKISKKAIMIKQSEIKVFPTKMEFYKNPKLLGEGYPFDYNMNSQVKLNVPVFVSHFSLDKKWVYVESPAVSGWVEYKDIGFVNKSFIKRFKTGKYYINTKDKNIIKRNKKRFKEIKMGTLIPKVRKVFLSVIRTKKGFAEIVYIENSSFFKKLGLTMNYKNIKLIMENLLNEPYGWGGKDNLRDCSLLTKDFFSSFGIFLERNSRGQASQGKRHNLSKMNNSQKRAYIMKHGKPYTTLLYMSGHVMLYVGVLNGEPMILHNAWTLKYNKNGKRVKRMVGRGVITTLLPGAKTVNDRYAILSKLSKLVVLR